MQIVGYEPGSPDEPATILVARNGAVEMQSLNPGTELEYGIDGRHCAGTVEKGRHDSCNRDTAPYCDVHSSVWPCARCRGDCAMPLETCYEEHAIYLAAFEPATFKVGVTRSWRLETRLTEQGARLAAHIRTVENGRTARQIEAQIANDIPDRVDVKTKIDGLDSVLDTDRWEALLDPYDVIETYAFEYGLSLDQQPIQTTSASGTVLGSRGRVLLLEKGETPYAIDLQSLVGYEILEGESESERQTSLGGF
ncbi:DUF2797 domain-containing protein [Halodesulfurarchaeum sp.]|uniref:DUF2797 domain-containing protein n=1 Tax=Halodesulfurarchaeum sp. TaxID=1980530 RepID=UPI002FC3ACDF